MADTQTDQHNQRPTFDLCVLIPAYNEQDRIQSTLLDVIKTLDLWDCTAEILVIDDGSSDDTVKVCNSIFAEHRINNNDRVISLPKNMGKGAAVAKGLSSTRSRWTLMMDADNSARLNELPKLAAHTSSDANHLVIGSRRMVTSEIHANITRVIVGTIYTVVLRVLGLSLARDTQCGFKLYSNHAARLISEHTRQNGFSFDIEHLLIAKHSGLVVPEVGIMWDHVDGSKVSPIIDGLKMLGQIIAMRGPVRKSVSKVRLGTPAPLVLHESTEAAHAQIEIKPQPDLVKS